MAIVYLTPEDLTLTQTNEVLGFLNSVQTAEEIAERIEIPDELDVGLRVGQHILDHRNQLPNGYTDLTQLMDVYQVGPERFTEIVSVVLGIPLPQHSPKTLNALIQRALADQLKSLPRQPATTTADKYRIQIMPPTDTPWLGQEITLGIKVIALTTQQPVANLPVSFESSDMWLSTQFGYEIREGQVISSRTATDGSVRLRLRNILDEPLTVDQFSALQDALRRLDTSAPAPRDMREQLQQLMNEYEDVRNKNLRSAIDIVYRTSGRHLTESLNLRDNMYQWHFHSGLLRVYLNADTQPLTIPQPIADATADQVGIYHIAWKLWLMPWYQIYLDQLSGNNLQQTFVEAKERIGTEAGVTAEILGHAYRYVATKKGLVGEALGKQVIDKEIQRFLAREITSFPAQSQRSMFPSLLLAGNTIGSTNTGTLALVNQTRADVEVILDERLGDNVFNADEIFSSLNQLSSRVDGLDSQFQTQDTRFGELQLEVNDMRGDMETLDAKVVTAQNDIVTINGELQRIDSNVLQLDANFLQVSNDFEQLELDLGNLDSSVKELDTRVGRLGTDVSRVDTSLQGIETTVAGVNTNVQQLDSQFSGLNTELTTLNRNAVLKTDITRDSQGKLLDIRTKPIRG